MERLLLSARFAAGATRMKLGTEPRFSVMIGLGVVATATRTPGY
jgi:hypothetical protein